MKYLDAQKAAGKEAKDSIVPENKMAPGSRRDQQRLDPKDPQSLISSPRGGSRAQTDGSVKRLADELNVDLTKVDGTGPNGSVTEKDVRAYKRANPNGQQENK